MKKTGPIIIFEDDPDDIEILLEIFKTIPIHNGVLIFEHATQVIEYLRATKEQPFLILSDINAAKMTGLELKAKMDSEPALKEKTIPFVFLSTSKDPRMVTKAYEHEAHGYFEKKDTMTEMHRQIQLIIQYWQESLHPRDS